jgi:uncharacterized protein YodC (DUF2158 family)
MAERKFRDGAVVRQKSGAVNMVVAGHNDRGQVICTFDEEHLELAGPEQPKRSAGSRQIQMTTRSGFC